MKSERKPIIGKIFLLLVMMATGLLSCYQPKKEAVYTGYIEGHYLFIAAPSAGRLVASPLQQGENIVPNTIAFVLDKKIDELNVAKAKTALHIAEDNLHNLQTGKRREELNAMRAQRSAIDVELQQAMRDAKRYQNLAKYSGVPKIQAEQAQTKVRQLQSEIKVIDANLVAAALPARKAQIAAAKAQLQAAQITLDLMQLQLARRTVYSHDAGKVMEVYVRRNEYVLPAQPVVKILSNEVHKVIFYVPEPILPQLHIGQKVYIRGNNSNSSVATITHINDAAEFTPPVIYSEATNQKLIFRVSALLAQGNTLPIGMPVSVSLSNESFSN